MIISNFAQNKLLSAVHAGALETPVWGDFLKILHAQTQADYTAIFLRQDNGEIQISELYSGEEQPWHRQIEIFHRDELVNFASLRRERVYALSEFTSADEDGGRAASAKLAIPSEYRHARFIHLGESNDVQAWIIIGRKLRDFAAADAAQLSAIAPHFNIALKTNVAINRERAAMRISNRAVDQLNFGWIAMDQNGHIINTDDIAEKLINDGTIINRLAQGRLQIKSRDANRLLSEQINILSQGKSPAPKSIHISDEPWLDLLVTPPAKTGKQEEGNAALIAYIHGDHIASNTRLVQITGMFGLTPAEAKLALALSRGRSIAQCAADQNISIHTARLYSKRIYSKTDTKGQADLVRLILSSLLAME